MYYFHETDELSIYKNGLVYLPPDLVYKNKLDDKDYCRIWFEDGQFHFKFYKHNQPDEHKDKRKKTITHSTGNYSKLFGVGCLLEDYGIRIKNRIVLKCNVTNDELVTEQRFNRYKILDNNILEFNVPIYKISNPDRTCSSRVYHKNNKLYFELITKGDFWDKNSENYIDLEIQKIVTFVDGNCKFVIDLNNVITQLNIRNLKVGKFKVIPTETPFNFELEFSDTLTLNVKEKKNSSKICPKCKSENVEFLRSKIGDSRYDVIRCVDCTELIGMVTTDFF